MMRSQAESLMESGTQRKRNFLSVVFTCCLLQLAAGESGYFWHVTDLHWDTTYSNDGNGISCNLVRDPNLLPEGGQFGPWGDYKCDSPWVLINSSIAAMKDIKADVDFVIWTGDDTYHTPSPDINYINVTQALDIINNLTQVIMTHFPTTQVYPVLGNHDWSPKSQQAPGPNSFYTEIGDMWSKWLTPVALNHFHQGGYYVMQIPQATVSMLLIGLNTNLYYRSNLLTQTLDDPADQFQWLEDTLNSARNNGSKVVLISHMEPGQFEKHRNTTWFYAQFNQRFISILSTYSDVISSAHFGHHHTDSFRLVLDDQGRAVSSFLIAPAVTPWETTLPGIMGGAGNNPGVRLVEYDRATGHVLDVSQYYMDIVAANDGSSSTLWKLGYNATNYYGIPDMKTSSLQSLASRLINDDALFDKYYKANGVFYPDDSWTRDFQIVHYCAITELDTNKFGDCIVNLSSGPTGGASVTSSLTSVIAGVSFGFILLIQKFSSFEI